MQVHYRVTEEVAANCAPRPGSHTRRPGFVGTLPGFPGLLPGSARPEKRAKSVFPRVRLLIGSLEDAAETASGVNGQEGDGIASGGVVPSAFGDERRDFGDGDGAEHGVAFESTDALETPLGCDDALDEDGFDGCFGGEFGNEGVG